MNKDIKFLYTRFLGTTTSFLKGFTIGMAIYESDHWAHQTILDVVRFHNKLKSLATEQSKKDYSNYSKKRCLGLYNLAYCPICNNFLNKIATIKEKIAAFINKEITGYDPMRVDIYKKSLEVIKKAGNK